MDHATDEILLTDGEAAKLLRILRTRLVRLARAGKVPCVILPDGEIRFSRADLIEWVAAYRHPAQAIDQVSNDRPTQATADAPRSG
jgi:excisionase family DNA binding protein